MLRPPDETRPECRDFQRRYEGGRGDAHLEQCDECRRFVEFVDGLRQLGLTAPLEDDLRSRLRWLPEQETGVPLFPRVPELPLPAALAGRLRGIARRGAEGRELPVWIRSPRYAVAASYLMTLLVAGTLGNPAAWASEAETHLAPVESAWHQVRTNGRETWVGLGEKAADHLHLTKDHLRATTSSLEARWTELVEWIHDPATPDDHDSIDDEVDVESGAETSH